MQIEYRKLTSLTPYWSNPRKNDDAVDAVAESIKEFGFKVPIIVDKDGVIIAGHTRYKAARKLKMKEVPTICADDLTEEQIKAFRLADNKVGELAEWDLDQLEIELANIDLDMTLFGFELDEDVDLFDDEEDEEIEGNEFPHKITIDKYVIPLTEDEYERFNDCYEEYVVDNDTNIGFVNDLLNKSGYEKKKEITTQFESDEDYF